MNKIRSVEAFWSFALSLLILEAIAIKTGDIGIVIRELTIFISGGVREISINNAPFFGMFLIILAVIAIEIPCSLIAGMISEKLLGNSNSHLLMKLLDRMSEGNLFFKFFALVLAEELFARWLFLGMLTKIPLLSGTLAFYILFVIGNGAWAIVHLKNFSEDEDRHILRVLPQFVAGIFFTYVFVKYGLLAVVLTHFASNAVVLSIHKVRKISAADVLITIYAGILSVVSYWLMDKPITDIMQWFVNNPTFTIVGWGFWDYVKVYVFISSCITVIFGLLLYDRSEIQKSKEHQGFIVTLMAVALVLIIIYVAYYALGAFIESIPYRIATLAISFAFLSKEGSASAVARTFWTQLPRVYLMICILQALSFWLAMGYFIINIILESPVVALREAEDN